MSGWQTPTEAWADWNSRSCNSHEQFEILRQELLPALKRKKAQDASAQMAPPAADPPAASSSASAPPKADLQLQPQKVVPTACLPPAARPLSPIATIMRDAILQLADSDAEDSEEEKDFAMAQSFIAKAKQEENEVTLPSGKRVPRPPLWKSTYDAGVLEDFATAAEVTKYLDATASDFPEA